MAETAPNTARNWRKERFRKYTMLPMWGRLATCAAVDYRRRSDASAGVPSGSGRLTIGRSLPSCPTIQVSRNASHADQVSEDDAFQGLRRGDPGIAAAAAQCHNM